MNIIITGPFGYGSLSDEIVLAGLLRHLARAKHDITVLSADPSLSYEAHGEELNVVAMPDPGQILSNAAAWGAISKANLAIVAGAGRINDSGKPPARVWLTQLEHAQRVGVKTVALGLAADKVDDARERARLQRLLHNCADTVSVRDDSSKAALMSYGLNANRISICGDLTLGMVKPVKDSKEPVENVTEREGKLGILLSRTLPTRTEFVPETCDMAPELAESVAALLQKIVASETFSNVHVFHEMELPNKITSLNAKNVQFSETDISVNELQTQVATCTAFVSLSYHGVLLSAASGVPVAGFAMESGTSQLLTSLGLEEFTIPSKKNSFECESAMDIVRKLNIKQAALRAPLSLKVRALARKEAQNARLVELLVPRRERPRVSNAQTSDNEEVI